MSPVGYAEEAASMVRIPAERLRPFVARVFERLEIPPQDAAVAADALVEADLCGVESHGVGRLRTWYVKGLREGTLNPKPKLRILGEMPGAALMDGDNGLGMVVAYRAMEEAIRRAQTQGVGVVVVKNSTHFGMAGYYSRLALQHDMIGLCLSAGAPEVLPTFGREPMLGTNPISVTAPAQAEDPFVLDMASSVIAGGKLDVAIRRGAPIPLGWALDGEGRPTTDPVAARHARKLLPLGGTRELGSHKGYGLALMVEILCGVLSGLGPAPTLSLVARGQLFGAINVQAFQPVADFKGTLDRTLRALKETPPVEGQERVLVAGEPEFITRRQRLAQGIPLHPNILASLRETAQELGVAYDLE